LDVAEIGKDNGHTMYSDRYMHVMIDSIND